MKFKYDSNKLTLIDDNKPVGTIDYKLEDNVFTIVKVYVVPVFQGKGYAKLLVEEVVRLAKEKNYMIKPLCSYSIGFFEKNPQYSGLLSK
jgi:predicted GNAT family acetyltransferase